MLTDSIVALCHFGNDWHNGGGSRGYRLLCLALRALRRRGINDRRILDGPMTLAQARIYTSWVCNKTDAIACPGVRRWPGR